MYNVIDVDSGIYLNYKHGLSRTRIYRIWQNMMDRCVNKSRHNYYLYGGNGISVCDEWKDDFVEFYNWSIENGYSDELSIDRIDSKGNYEPNNCRWVNDEIQANNKKSTIMIDYKGEVKNLTEWCKEFELEYNTINRLMKRGLTFEQAMNKPKHMRIEKYKKILKGDV